MEGKGTGPSISRMFLQHSWAPRKQMRGHAELRLFPHPFLAKGATNFT